MRNFKITEKIEVVCQSESTRSGFRHLATLLINGVEQVDAKCCYLNRTWERYTFQSVLSKVVEKALKEKIITAEEEKSCRDFIEGDQTDWSGFKITGMVAQLGDLFCNTKEEKNNWKARMLKAGLQGLEIPEDWETLSEDEKESRLNGVIEIASTGGK